MDCLEFDLLDWVALIISFLTFIFTLIFNVRTLINYNNSIQPVLRCSFFKNKNKLFLSIKNVGKTEARNIVIDCLSLDPLMNEIGYKKNNIFKNYFNLLPEEEVIGEIGYFLENVNVNLDTVYLSLSFELFYKNNKFLFNKVYLKKELLLNNYIFPELSVKTDLDTYKIQDYLRGIGNANTRLANYFDGNVLFQYDEKNIMPNTTFQRDLRKFKRGYRNKKRR